MLLGFANFHTAVAPSGVGCEVDLGVAAWMSAVNSVGLSGRRCQFHNNPDSFLNDSIRLSELAVQGLTLLFKVSFIPNFE